MIIEDDDGTTTYSIRGGAVYINGMPEEEFKKMSDDDRSVQDEEIKDLVRETCIRASLALAVYNAMLDETDTFEGEVGGDLAYLMGEILKGDKFQAWLGSNDEFMRLLVRSFDTDNTLWNYVDIMNDDTNDVFPVHIKVAILGAASSGGAIGNLDEEDYPQAAAWVDVLKGGGS